MKIERFSSDPKFTKFNHPHLTKDEAIKIVTEKNNRKKQKRNERSNKGGANKG